MKWLSYLLLIYMAVMVTTTLHACDHADMEISTDQHQDHEEPCCPPFSWCKNCSHFIASSSVSYFELFVGNYKQEKPIAAEFFRKSLQLNFIWQPPQ